MYVVSEDNYLEHYGRKGMKWGQHIFGQERSNENKRYDNMTKEDLKKWRRDFKKDVRRQKVDRLISKVTKRYLKAESIFNQNNNIYALSEEEQRKIFEQEEKWRKEAGVSEKHALDYRALKPLQAELITKINKEVRKDRKELIKVDDILQRYKWSIDIKYDYRDGDIDANNFVSARPVIVDKDTGTEYPYSKAMIKSIKTVDSYIDKYGRTHIKN